MGYFADNIIIALEAVMPVDEATDEKAQNLRMAKKVSCDVLNGLHDPNGTVDKYRKNTKAVNSALSAKERLGSKALYAKELVSAIKHKENDSDDPEEDLNKKYDDMKYSDKEKKLRYKTQSAMDAVDRHNRRHGKSLKEAFDSLYEED